MQHLISLIAVITVITRPVLAAPVSAIRDVAFPDALISINATALKASTAKVQGSVDDTGVLDDLQKLLNIIAGHVERMREATHGNGTTAGQVPAPEANRKTNNRPTTATTRKTANGAVIVNHGTLPQNDNHPQGQRQGEEQIGGLEVVTNSETGFTNITCKGISVCNPVTVINEKGGKKIKPGKLDKAAEKAKKKAGGRKTG